MLYDEHLLHARKACVSTICVGNIAVGGTGKTPMVEYLLRLLTPKYKVAVVSLGYGRKTHGFRLAGDEETAWTIGDEPMQIHRAFPDVPLAVGKDRLHAIQQLKKRYPDLQVVILDDGFQYRRIKPDYTILLTAEDNLYTHDDFLPVGRLRDNRYRSKDANTVVVTNCPATMQPIDRRVISNEIRPLTFQHLCFATTRYLPLALPGTPLVVTGIAHPQYLFRHIQEQYPQAELLAFPDHHRFRKKDIEQILRRAQSFAAVVTTQKDYERLVMTPIVEALGDKLYVQAITHDLSDTAEAFARPILLYLSEHIRALNTEGITN